MREEVLISAKFGKNRGLYTPLRLTPVARRSLWDARLLCRSLYAPRENEDPRGFAPLLVGVAAASHRKGETTRYRTLWRRRGGLTLRGCPSAVGMRS